MLGKTLNQMQVQNVGQNPKSNTSFKMNAIIDRTEAAGPFLKHVEYIFAQHGPNDADVWIKFVKDAPLTGYFRYQDGKQLVSKSCGLHPETFWEQVSEMATKIAENLSRTSDKYLGEIQTINTQIARDATNKTTGAKDYIM